MESLQARLLRVKLEDRVTIAPTEEEMQALAQRPGDPLIESVAGKLIALTAGEKSDIARLALRELYATIS
jgi:hypothetical protein